MRGLNIWLIVKLFTVLYHNMNKRQVVVILDNIRSRENVGSIFRTADAAGVSKIYLCGITPQPPHEKISKTALGADLTVPWKYHKQTWRLIEKLKKDGYQIIALERTKDAENIFKIKRNSKLIALIVGNEVDGLSREVINRCDMVASIPMYGKKESLNVSVAFGIAVYSIRN